MKKAKRIFLTGMMGAGKTTLGKKLAEALHLPFLDLDELLVKEEGISVPDIFSRFGEDYFRVKETEMLHRLIANEQDFVLATGGGTPCFFQNAETLFVNGICIWLDPPAGEILKRLQKENVQQRPMLENKSGKELVQHLYALRQKRLPFYKKAHLHLTDVEVPVTAIIGQITKFL